MIRGELRRIVDGTTALPKVQRTTSVLERMKGLLFSPRPQSGEALLIDPCSSVHCIGMRYPIDVAYLSQDMEVIKTVPALRPMRMSACFGARMTLEMASGQLREVEIEVGDKLSWHEHATA